MLKFLSRFAGRKTQQDVVWIGADLQMPQLTGARYIPGTRGRGMLPALAMLASAESEPEQVKLTS